MYALYPRPQALSLPRMRNYSLAFEPAGTKVNESMCTHEGREPGDEAMCSRHSSYTQQESYMQISHHWGNMKCCYIVYSTDDEELL
jgi:hypothetical protein